MSDEIQSIIDDDRWPPAWMPIEKSKTFVRFVETGGWHDASCKWDGCIHFYKYDDEPLDPQNPDHHTSDVTYIHYCDIDEEIDRLKRLKAAAYSYFSEIDESHEFWKPPEEQGTPMLTKINNMWINPARVESIIVKDGALRISMHSGAIIDAIVSEDGVADQIAEIVNEAMKKNSQ